jgi:hypothetical protein
VAKRAKSGTKVSALSTPQVPTGLPDAIAAQLMALGAQGPTNPVSITKADTNWSDFQLSDGTILRVRPQVTNVRHEPGRFNDRGEPIYHFNIGFAVTPVSPAHLMQGYRNRKSKRQVKRKK